MKSADVTPRKCSQLMSVNRRHVTFALTAEVAEQLVFDAEQQLVRLRRAVVADAIGVARLGMIRIEARDALEGAELAEVGEAVAVRIDRRVVDVRVVRDLRRRSAARAVRIQLRRERPRSCRARSSCANLFSAYVNPTRGVTLFQTIAFFVRRRVERRHERPAAPGWPAPTPPSTELADAIPAGAEVQRQPIEASACRRA